ncbi:outer membrane protein [Legionella sp. CNM-1927-20]|uniref:outer membrane protein n=1 Tax=Legionella sp. CNM-1927-20 TaxID=3422221 RepID=UPI00403A7E61
MSKKIGLVCLFLAFPLHAGTIGEFISSDYSWFASVGTGFSWTEKPGIYNPDPAQWDPAVEGYDASLGDRGFYTFAIGMKALEFIDVGISYLNHEVFNYQKFQTGEQTIQTAFTGNARTRFFQLDNRALLINCLLHSSQNLANFRVNIIPFVSGGIGYAHNQVYNFYTVGSTTVADTAIGSTSSIGSANNTNSFAWQGSAGLSFNPNQSYLGINIGYRYFNGGKFNTSSKLYTNSNGIVNTKNWSGYLKANQVFFELQYWV